MTRLITLSFLFSNLIACTATGTYYERHEQICDDDGNVIGWETTCMESYSFELEDGTEVEVGGGPGGVTFKVKANGGTTECTPPPELSQEIQDFIDSVENCECGGSGKDGGGGSSSGLTGTSLNTSPFDGEIDHGGECGEGYETEGTCTMSFDPREWDCTKVPNRTSSRP